MIVLLIAGSEADEPTYDANSAMGVTILTRPLSNGAESGRRSSRTARPSGGLFTRAIKGTEAVGLVWAPHGQPRVAFGFTILHGKIVEIDLVADPERLRQLDLVILED
jgi:hypothetical protein